MLPYHKLIQVLVKEY